MFTLAHYLVLLRYFQCNNDAWPYRTRRRHTAPVHGRDYFSRCLASFLGGGGVLFGCPGTSTILTVLFANCSGICGPAQRGAAFVQVPYSFWLHVAVLFVGPLLALQAAALLAARGGAPVRIFARRAPRARHPLRPEAKARALLQAAAAAAITCNLNGRSPGGADASPWRRGAAGGAARARRGGARWLLTHLGFATWLLRSPLGSPLRERIHLETLVFLSMDYCATAPHVVADVILQVPPPPAHAATFANV